MSTKRNSNKSNRAKKHVVKQEPPTTWSSVHELATMVDAIIRKSAESLLEVKESKETSGMINEKYSAEMAQMTNAIVDIKQQLSTAIAGMPTSPNTVVSEDMYPDYLERFVNIQALHDRFVSEVIPTLGEVTTAVLSAVNTSEEEK